MPGPHGASHPALDSSLLPRAEGAHSRGDAPATSHGSHAHPDTSRDPLAGPMEEQAPGKERKRLAAASSLSFRCSVFLTQGCCYALSWLIRHCVGRQGSGKDSQCLSQQLVQLEQEVSLFQNCAGACERILKTPIPAGIQNRSQIFFMPALTGLPIPVSQRNWCRMAAVVSHHRICATERSRPRHGLGRVRRQD
jgi:hypothetical protein